MHRRRNEPDAAAPTRSIADASVVELRQYTLRPGARDTLLALFERELIEPQEAVGMTVGGVFHDRDDPDRFVWFRGFPDLPSRRRSLEAFYLGPVWRRHRQAANATMLASDNVLLLRPTTPPRPVPGPDHPRTCDANAEAGDEWVVVEVYELSPDAGLLDRLSTDVHAVLEDALGIGVGAWISEPGPNDFPQLPVREAANAFVWTATFEDRRHYQDACASLAADPRWQRAASTLSASLIGTQVLNLRPTTRSQHPATRRNSR